MKEVHQKLADALVNVARRKLCKFEIEELIQFKDMNDALNKSLYNAEPVDSYLLVQLVNRVKHRIFNLPGYTLDQFLTKEQYTSVCGCMGPRAGESYCNCAMVSYENVYKFDIAIAILKEFENEKN